MVNSWEIDLNTKSTHRYTYEETYRGGERERDLQEQIQRLFDYQCVCIFLLLLTSSFLPSGFLFFSLLFLCYQTDLYLWCSRVVLFFIDVYIYIYICKASDKSVSVRLIATKAKELCFFTKMEFYFWIVIVNNIVIKLYLVWWFTLVIYKLLESWILFQFYLD